MDIDSNHNEISAEERAKLAVYACYRLVLLNVQLVISSDLPICFYADMKSEEDHSSFKNLLKYLHDNKVADLSILLPYIEKFNK